MDAGGKVPALVAAFSLHGITGTVQDLGGMGIADHRVAMPTLAAMLVASIALALTMSLAWRRRALFACGLAALAVVGLWVSAVAPTPQVRHGILEVTAMDVGQGDSLLLVSPQGKTLLIDAGGAVGGQQSDFDFGENVVSSYLWERGISRLDAVAITHGHSDHIGGMHSVLNNFRPRELWVGALPKTPAIDALLAFSKSLGIQVIRHSEGESFEFGGARLAVLSPPADWRTMSQPKNNDSLVLRVSFGESSVLLEGDAERPVEQQMTYSEDLKSDLLKVGHHGSATSSSPEFIHAVKPRWAVISVGATNTFGHPRRETLELLQQEAILTYRTDRNGAVTFYLDGKSVSPQLACLR